MELEMVVVSAMGTGSNTHQRRPQNHLWGTLPGTPSDHHQCIHMCMMMDLVLGSALAQGWALAQGQDMVQVQEQEILLDTIYLRSCLRNFLVTHCSNHPDPILCKFHNHQNN